MKTTKKPTLADLAREADVSLSTLLRYRAAGVDVTDPEEIRAYGETLKNRPRGAETAEMREARLRKINLEADRIEHALGVQRGLFISAQEVRNDMLRIGAAVRGAMEVLRADVPTWEGLPASTLEKRINDAIESIYRNLHDTTSSLYGR